jgi:hypothetical protein
MENYTQPSGLMPVKVSVNLNPQEGKRLLEACGKFRFGGFFGPSLISWDISPIEHEISVFVDDEIDPRKIRSSSSKLKVAILLEPLESNPSYRASTLLSIDLLDAVLTYDQKLLALGGKFISYSPGGTLLRPPEALSITRKSRLISMSVSDKKYLPGHKIRHEIASTIAHRKGIDLMGRGFTSYESPMAPYATYHYSVVVENAQHPSYFTEKLLECLIGKCIPVYWGATKLPEGVNEDGILRFSSLDELEKILEVVSVEKYNKLSEAIEQNSEWAYSHLSKDLNIQKALAGRVLPRDYAQVDLIELTVDPMNFLAGNGPLIQTEVEQAPGPTALAVRQISNTRKRLESFWKSRVRYRFTLVIKTICRGIMGCFRRSLQD